MNIIEIFEKTPDLLQDREKVKALFYAAFDMKAILLHQCKDCMLFRNETCFGNNNICEDYRFAPTIPIEEMDLWLKMSDASFYRLGGRFRY